MKAQLILVGGRPMPNILTIVYQKPELIVAVCSLQSFEREWSSLKKAIKNLLPECKIEERVVDGYLLDQIEPACESMLGCSSEEKSENWVFNITNATSIMSIGAYNVAKRYEQKKQIDCWYLDTARSRVIALVGNAGDEKVFSLKVQQYVAAYDCRLALENLEEKEEREYCEQHWLPFTQLLVNNPYNIDLLKKFVKEIRKPKKGDGPQKRSIPDSSEDMYALLTLACDNGLLSDLRREKGRISFSISSSQANYLDGPWLEAYVWNEARQLDIFSDCLWNQKLIADEKLTDKDGKNQLDVSMIYKAQLFIVECKTGEREGFDANILYKLDSVANPLGNQFVGKMAVVSIPIPDKDKREEYKQFLHFKEKADERGITIVTRETLASVGRMLKKMAEEPKYNR